MVTPSETLSAAADLIRDLAAKASDGPWREYFDTPGLLVGPYGSPVCRIVSPVADGRWIAALSPALAEPIERWLRETAANAEQSIPAWRNSSVDGYPGPKRTDEEVASLVEHHYGAALAVAARVLGKEKHG